MPLWTNAFGLTHEVPDLRPSRTRLNSTTVDMYLVHWMRLLQRKRIFCLHCSWNSRPLWSASYMLQKPNTTKSTFRYYNSHSNTKQLIMYWHSSLRLLCKKANNKLRQLHSKVLKSTNYHHPRVKLFRMELLFYSIHRHSFYIPCIM